MKEVEVLYFHEKLQDPARKRGVKSDHGGNIFVFVWNKIFVVLHCQQNHKKVALTKNATGKTTTLFFVEGTIPVLTKPRLYSRNHQTWY